MTISTSAASTIALGDGSNTTFNIPFICDSASFLEVVFTDTDGSQTTLDSSTYTVFINPPAVGQIWGVGGTLTYPLTGSPIASGTSLTISRILPYTQVISISNQGDFAPRVTEEMGDTLAMQIQQVVARTGQMRGTWITNTDYNYGDVVQDGANGSNSHNYYMCAIANTSSVWATDLAAGDWSLAIQSTLPVTLLPLSIPNGGTGTTGATGTAGSVVLSISPTLVTPILGIAAASSLNVTTANTPNNGINLAAANTLGLYSRQTLGIALANPASTVNYWSFQGAIAGNPAYLYTTAAGASSKIGTTHDSKGTTTSGQQFYGTIDSSGKHFFQINGANVLEITDTWWNPNVSYQGAPTAWPVFSSGALAGGPDNICVIGCNSSIYPGTANGVTIMYCARGTTGAHHFTSNGVVAHVNVASITNPAGIDTYNTAESALWFYGAATGNGGGAVISTQGVTANGTLFYDAGTGGYEFQTDNTVTKLLKLIRVASGVNGWSITSAVTTGQPILQPYGSDSNIGAIYKTKGTGNNSHSFYDGGVIQAQIGGGSTSTSYLSMGGGINEVVLSAQGGSNPAFTFYTTGTGGFAFKTSNTANTVLSLADGGNVTANTGNFVSGLAAKGLILKRGANGKVGQVTLTGTTAVTVTNSSIATSDLITFSLSTVGGTVGAYPVIKTITSATGFTVAGTVGDISTYNYAVISNAN